MKARKLNPYRFALSHEELADFVLRIDFAPLIQSLNLQGSFVLLHWQARPKGLRRWGAFWQHDGDTGYWFARRFEAEALECEGVQLDENVVITVPTACILYRNARLVPVADYWRIVGAGQNVVNAGVGVRRVGAVNGAAR